MEDYFDNIKTAIDETLRKKTDKERKQIIQYIHKNCNNPDVSDNTTHNFNLFKTEILNYVNSYFPELKQLLIDEFITENICKCIKDYNEENNNN